MSIGPNPGVTGILKVQEAIIPGNLALWGANQAIDRILEGRPWNGATPEEIRAAAIQRVQRAQRIGTLVHEQIALILAGGTPTPTEETAPYIYAYSSFLAAERPRFVAVEKRVINRRARYGGTLDFMTDRAIGDVKTGKPKLTHRLQLAGYLAAEGFGGTIDQYHRYWWEPDEAIEPLPRVREGWILYLRPEGYELVRHTITAADKRHFLALVKAYHRIRAWENGQ